MIIFTNQPTNGDCPRTRVVGVVAHHNLIEKHTQTGSEISGMFMSLPFLEHILDFISTSSI